MLECLAIASLQLLSENENMGKTKVSPRRCGGDEVPMTHHIRFCNYLAATLFGSKISASILD
jgi:hypothetical protein